MFLVKMGQIESSERGFYEKERKRREKKRFMCALTVNSRCAVCLIQC